MISLSPLIQLLTPKPVGFGEQWFRTVDGAGKFAQVRAEALPLPALWVVRSADSPRHLGERAEEVTVAFDLVIAVPNTNGHKPNAADDLLLVYRQAVKTLVLGWRYQPHAKPAKYSGGKVLEYTTNDLYWADSYSLQTVVSNYLPDPVTEFTGIDMTKGEPN